MQDLQEQIATLKNGGQGKKPPPPDWVQPNTNPSEQKATPSKRKKRAHNVTWTRREPTQTVEHACDTCPDCGRGLSGGWEHSRHQIVEIAPVAVEVVDHLVIARHCGVCGKACVPAVDTTQETVGQSYYGHRLVSLIAYLRTLGRLPKQTIATLLETLFGVHLSVGAIRALLQRVATQAKSAYEALGKSVQSSAYGNADETRWRENGQNG